jgi:putative NADPH-quinone reductase
MPVPLKAFFQQIMRPYIPFQYEKWPPEKLFEGRSARIIVMLGVPVLFYRLNSFGGADDIKRLKRDMSFVGIAPIYESLFGMVEMADTRKWLGQIRELGAKAL